MIKDPPILRISRNFPRPPNDVVKALTGAMTGHLVDAMGGGGALDWQIKALGGGPQSFCGVAVTCDCGPSDNLALFGALDVVKPGDVIVAATRSHRAASVTGDLLVGMARNCGAAAIVTDGVVRDVAGILAVGLPVCCAGVSPNSPVRNGPGTVGLPIVVGGVAIASGDIIVGDADGVVVVPQAIAADLVKRLVDVRAAEALLEAKVKSGLRIPDFIADVLSSPRVENID
ncbi:RraA family protein [Aestuariivirga sp.]|uniref:RraA family protein n=1 Tax=Aestuariivirga sp. TaxID=2650926 RepID=UPI003593327E